MTTMSAIWILAANSARATIFAADSPTAPLTEVAGLDNPDARAKQMELATDRPGRTFDSHGMGRHAKSAEVEPKEEAQIRFAKLLAERLEQARVGHAFERLVLVAAPAFLGQLRAQLGAPLKSQVSLEIDADYTALKPRELRARLPERL
jgi:protein required for attachment to host cells